MLENKYKVIYDETSKLFPNARCELNYNNLFEPIMSSNNVKYKEMEMKLYKIGLI